MFSYFFGYYNLFQSYLFADLGILLINKDQQVVQTDSSQSPRYCHVGNKISDHQFLFKVAYIITPYIFLIIIF